MALPRWLVGLACVGMAGGLAACQWRLPATVAGDADPGLPDFAEPQIAAAGTGAAQGPQARANAQVGTTTLGGRFTSDDEMLRILTDRDYVDRDELVAKLETDPDILALIGASPLINDGGAVFLSATDLNSGSAFRTATAYDVNLLHPPRWKRLEVGVANGRFDNALRCRDPLELADRNLAGYRSICIDPSEGVADVTSAQRVRGWFVIDRYPFSRIRLAEIRAGDVLTGMGAKLMNMVSFSRSRFRRTDAGWQFDSVSPTQLSLAETSAQSVHILSTELAQGGQVLATTRSPYALEPSKNLRRLPRDQQVVLRVQVAGDGAWVFAEQRGKIHRLEDDGQWPDLQAGDGVYTAEIRTPPESRKVHRLMVHAFASHTLATETDDDYDADTWIVPLRVD